MNLGTESIYCVKMQNLLSVTSAALITVRKPNWSTACVMFFWRMGMNRTNNCDQNAVVKVFSWFSDSVPFAAGHCVHRRVLAATAAQWRGGRKHARNRCVFGLLGRSSFAGRTLNRRTHWLRYLDKSRKHCKQFYFLWVVGIDQTISHILDKFLWCHPYSWVEWIWSICSII